MFSLKIQKNKNKGFVLLFSVLVSTLVLSVGISIISIALKQVILSGAGRDSQYAFYAANTGAECAYYWNLASTTAFVAATHDPDNIKCIGMPITDDAPDCVPTFEDDDTTYCFDNSTPNITKTKFKIDFANQTRTIGSGISGATITDTRPYCAIVTVVKVNKNAGLPSATTETTISSYGYNTCDKTNPRRIERALELRDY